MVIMCHCLSARTVAHFLKSDHPFMNSKSDVLPVLTGANPGKELLRFIDKFRAMYGVVSHL